MLKYLYYFLLSLNVVVGIFFSCCGCPPPFQAPCQSNFQSSQIKYPIQQPAEIVYVQVPKKPNIIAKPLPYDSFQPYYVRPQPPRNVYATPPPPKKDPCYMNSSGFKCCNSDLENAMHGAYSDLKNSPNFNDCNIESALAIADITHDDQMGNSTGEVISDKEKEAKIEKLNKELVNVEPTGKELHERRQRAISNVYDAVYIHDDEFFGFSQMNTSTKGVFLTHELTMGSFNPSLTRMKLKRDDNC
uniref:Uncharacterized protein n=1 Tax=Panagrolaimus sp. JU765 TaxID=591449 RepID=A0AC34QTW0_9BILA